MSFSESPMNGKGNEITDPNGTSDEPDSFKPTEDPLAFCERHILGMKRKADHNKQESLWSFYFVIGPSLLAPLFVTFGSEWISGKLIPSALSLAAAGSIAWLQLRKPQQLWSIYRSAQRELEDQKNRFLYRIGAYANDLDPGKLLATKVSDIAIGTHHQWVPLVPSPEQYKPTSVQIDTRSNLPS